MPYKSNGELPTSVRKNLPSHAQDIYRQAFNHAFGAHKTEARQEEAAHRIAWAAVERRYSKDAGVWKARLKLARAGKSTDEIPGEFGEQLARLPPGRRLLWLPASKVATNCPQSPVWMWMVPKVGIEPTHLAVLDFESSASTSSTTWAGRLL
jgi:cation transport regulator